MVLRLALYGCVLGLFAFAHPAFANDPAWHTGKVLQILVRMSTNPFFRHERVVHVDMEPPFAEPCGTRFVALGWPEHLEDHSATQGFEDAATALLTDAMFAQSTVSVYLSERFNASGERYCGITRAQVAAAGIRPTPTTVDDTGAGDTYDTGTGDTGTGDDADDNDDAEYGWGGIRHLHPRNWFKAIIRSTKESGETAWVADYFGETRNEAHSRTMGICRDVSLQYGGLASTCQVIADFPTDGALGKPYCWAYAESNDLLVYGTGGVDDAPNETYYAMAERIALDACIETGGIGCEIVFSDCHGGPDFQAD